MGPRVEKEFLGRFSVGTEEVRIGASVTLTTQIHNRDRKGSIIGVDGDSVTVGIPNGSTTYAGETINQMQIEVNSRLRFVGVKKRLRYSD